MTFESLALLRLDELEVSVYLFDTTQEILSQSLLYLYNAAPNNKPLLMVVLAVSITSKSELSAFSRLTRAYSVLWNCVLEDLATFQISPSLRAISALI